MHPHTLLASFACFVGAFQLVFRWQWSNHMRVKLDRTAVRVWAFSTGLTALLIAYAMKESQGYPIDKWYWMACGVVTAKFCASIVSVFALRNRIKKDVPL